MDGATVPENVTEPPICTRLVALFAMVSPS